MLLSDRDVEEELRRGELKIEGLTEGAIGASSIDLMLANDFVFFNDPLPHESVALLKAIDPKQDHSQDGIPIHVEDDDYYVLNGGDFALACTRECFTFPPHLAGLLEGKSSLARLGLVVHVTAGFFDAGFPGYPTLELFNVRRRPIRLYPGMPIAQMAIMRMSSPASVPYNRRGTSKYANQDAKPMQSMYHRNFEKGPQ